MCIECFTEDKSIILIQYLFDGEEHAVTPQTHGNCRQTQATGYVRTKPSVLERIKDISENCWPKGTVHQVSEENGGYLQATSASDLPRNRDQAKNCRSRNPKPSSKSLDSLSILLQECKRQQMSTGQDPFIRDVTGAPELRCVLKFTWQLDETEKFCTNPRKFSVFSADPTFNLGRFNLTVTTYRHLKLVTRREGNHPLMIGPLLVSQTKTSETYNYFFGKLASLNKNLKNIMAFGTDGEEALIEAMKNVMSYAIHLRCFGHFRDNCKAKLKQSNVPDSVQLEFLNDIFGKRYDETFEKGKTIVFHPISRIKFNADEI